MSFVVVNSEYGPIKGIQTTSALGTSYVSFQNIPYMKAPTGKLRFRDAQPPEKWSEPFDATGDACGYFALDYVTGDCVGQEDAGILNIFTKNVKPADLYPVMIWIHGGGFIHGNSKTELFGPDYLIEKDVILVSINYRLGAIGFLSLRDKSLNIPGNAGLKDQLFAIKWVKRNIKNFGGDPDNISIFGESAGGASCHLLSISQQSKGLFRRAIAMSGSSFCKTWAMTPRSYCQKNAVSLARKLGYDGPSEDEKSLLEFLENAPAEEIVKLTPKVLRAEDIYGFVMISPFSCVVEPYESENCLIPRDPVEMAKSAWSNEIEMLFTGNSFEGAIRGSDNEERAIKFLENPAYFLPLLELNMNPYDPKAKQLGLKIKNLYFDGKHVPRESLLRFSSELLFWNGIDRALQLRIKHARGKTFLMRFNVDAEFNIVKKLKNCEEYRGAGHGDDLFYLFKTIVTEVPEKGSREFIAIERMSEIFTGFAKTGDPNCRAINFAKFLPLTDVNHVKCVEISENGIGEIELPELKKLKVWRSVLEESEKLASKL